MAEPTYNQIRQTALNLRMRSLELFGVLSPIVTASQTWTLDGLDSELPDLAELKTLTIAYEKLEKMDLNLQPDKLAVMLSGVDSVPLEDLQLSGFVLDTLFAVEHDPVTGVHAPVEHPLTQAQADELTGGTVTSLHNHDIPVYSLEVHDRSYHSDTYARSEHIEWVGNDSDPRTINFTTGEIPKIIFFCRKDSTPGGGYIFVWAQVFVDFTAYFGLGTSNTAAGTCVVNTSSITLSGGAFNIGGFPYSAELFF